MDNVQKVNNCTSDSFKCFHTSIKRTVCPALDTQRFGDSVQASCCRSAVRDEETNENPRAIRKAQ
jgi:hypothetical protein